MYFSNHNKDITYSNIWGGTLEVCGKGAVCREDTDVSPGTSKGQWGGGYYHISLTDGITGAKAGFLEAFTDMQSLIISRTVTGIEMTEGLRKLLMRNKVLIRGWYGTYAERFARENGLKFLHADILVGWNHEEAHYTNTKLTLCFRGNGSPYLNYDDYCPGISAGNNGGGTYERELPDGFPRGWTLQDFADCYPRFRQAILTNEDLSWYFRTAGKR